MNYLKTLSIFIFVTLTGACTEAKTKGKTGLAQQTEDKKTIESDFIQKKITENLYVLKSPDYNTNAGVFIGAKEILLIDPMTGMNNHQNLLNAIKGISAKPIKYVLNTHSHPDHNGANAFFADLGAMVISHENTKYSKGKYDVFFKDTYTIEMGNESIQLFHSIAHTFDDVLVYFKENNTVFMGDTYMTNSFPHFYYGGGSEGHLKNIDKALSIGNAETNIIPAHGKLVSNKQELTAHRKNTVQWINRIKKLHKEGKTITEIASDNQIKELSLVFNDGKNVSEQSIQRTINKTTAVDLVESIGVSENTLKSYEGKYQFGDKLVAEIVYQNEKLIFRSEGSYIYEIVPVSETKFQLKGQFPYKHLTFENKNQKVVFFNGKENLNAKRI